MDEPECVRVWVLFDTQQKAGAEKKGHLLAGNGPRFDHRHHLRDNEEMVLVRLDFRALAEVEDILKGEGMEIKVFSKRLKQWDVAEAVQFHPKDRAVCRMLGEFRDGRDFTVFQSVFVVQGITKAGRGGGNVLWSGEGCRCGAGNVVNGAEH
jgi:hypothetical protein